MSSSEEYLDSLLKSLTENTEGTGAEPADLFSAAETQETPKEADGGPDGSSDMDDVAAMFAAMGAETPESGEPDASADIAMEDLSLDGSTWSGDLSSDEGNEVSADSGFSLDELSLDDGALMDEMPLDGGALMDEMPLDGGALMDEMPLDDGALMDELSLDDGALMDEMPLDGGLSLDESSLGAEENREEPSAQDDEPIMDDLALEELLGGGFGSEQQAEEDGLSSDAMPSDDDAVSSDEMAPDDIFSLDEFSLGAETMPDEQPSEEEVSGDPDLSELINGSGASDDLRLDDLNLDGLGLDALGLEENGQDDGGNGSEDHFALEETGEEDADLSALLESMGGDKDLSEINDLLEKSDQGVAVDDSVMSLLDDAGDGSGEEDSVFDFFAGEEEETSDSEEQREPENIREITQEELEERASQKTKKQKKKEEKERKKREKQARKKKGAGAEGTEEDSEGGLDALLQKADDAGERPKKKGLSAKLADLLFEEDESGISGSDDVELALGNLSNENQELLDELSAEDKKNAKKKEKKENKKEKKEKKGKKSGKKAPEAAENEEGEGEEQPQKAKKAKKKKKEKEKAVEEEPKIPEKKLSRKKVMSVFLFCATIAACIVIVTTVLPAQMEKQEARVAFDQDQYEQVYDLLYGKKLNEEDDILFQKSSVILQMQRKLDSYENYKKLDMQADALDALLDGVVRYQELWEKADQYNVNSEVADIYEQILDALADDYGLSESAAEDIIASGDDVTYSQRVQAVISGETYAGEEEPEGNQDVLPEEEEIIDRLQGTETE